MQNKPTGTPDYRPILFSITIAVFMCLLDSHIVRICLPVIARDFAISSGQSSWINLAYLLVAAPALPVFGKIADIIGYKNIFISGYSLFTIGSMLCGISPNANALVISRLIQGIGGGMLLASGPSMIPKLVPPDRRGFAFGLQATAAGVGISLGAPLGGILTDLLSWRYIFYINVPVSMAGIYFAVRSIPQDLCADVLKTVRKRLDIPGSIYLYLSLLSLTLGLSLLSKFKTRPAPLLLLMTVGLVFMLFFVKRMRHCPEPLIDLSLFTRPFSRILLSTFTGYIIMTGNGFMMPFYLMGSLKLTPAQSGLMILFFSLSFSLFSSLAGRLADLGDPKKIGTLGMLGTAGAFAFFAAVAYSRSVLQTALFLFLYGTMFAFFVAPTNKLFTICTPASKQGIANGIYRTAVLLATLAGLAIYGSLMDSVTASTPESLFSHLYLYSVLLPLSSCILIYFSNVSSPLADETKTP